MKFLMTYEQTKQSAPATPAKMAEIAKFSQEMAKAGVLLMTGGLQRPTKGTHLKLAAGDFSMTDGPFAETKELIDGFALIEASTREQAIDVAKRFMLIAGDGTSEILAVYDHPVEVPR
jgi:hypothetical protein